MGAFDEMDPRSLHMLGMHGSAYANYAMQTADCIIALGARFDDRVTGNLKSMSGAFGSSFFSVGALVAYVEVSNPFVGVLFASRVT